jgi:hypothetical protein
LKEVCFNFVWYLLHWIFSLIPPFFHERQNCTNQQRTIPKR